MGDKRKMRCTECEHCKSRVRYDESRFECARALGGFGCAFASKDGWNPPTIESLSAENEKLKCQIKTAYRKGLRHFAKALKDYDRTDGAWTDYFEHTVDEVLQKEQEKLEGLGTTEDQLAKAKHYIKELARAVEHSYSVLSWQRPPIKAEAEQFISEVEK